MYVSSLYLLEQAYKGVREAVGSRQEKMHCPLQQGMDAAQLHQKAVLQTLGAFAES